jgi:hypothetical protein
MQHVQSENVRNAIRTKWELLRVGDGVEPGTPDEVRRDNIWRELFEKTGTGADLNGKSIWFARGEQSRKKLVVVHAPQNGFLLPNAAVQEKLLVSLRIGGHCAFFDCTEFGGGRDEKLAGLFGCRYQKKTVARTSN